MKTISRTILFASVLLAAFLLPSCEELSPLGGYIYDQLSLPVPAISSTADANGYSNTDITITLAPPAEEPDVTIRYSTDRSDPSGGTVYTGPFTIGGHNTPILVKAVSQKDLCIDSAVVQEEYLILYDSAEPPVFSPVSGAYDTDQAITISSASSGAAIWYTTDGTDPRSSVSRSRYSGPIAITDDGTPDGSQVVLNAVSQVSGLPDSPLVASEYSVLYGTLSAPELSPPSQQSLDPISVTLTSPDGAAIWYTLDGTSPLRTSSGGLEVPSGTARLYTGPIDVNWSGYDSRTIKAACVAENKRASAVQIGSYFYQLARTPLPDAEVYNPADGLEVNDDGAEYWTSLSDPRLRIANGETGTRYYYTVDGTMPQIDVEDGTVTILNPDTRVFSYGGSLNLADEITGLATSEDRYTFTIVAVGEGMEASSPRQVVVNTDRTPPPPPTLSPSWTTGSDGAYYVNAQMKVAGTWSVAVTSNAPDSTGEFLWKWDSQPSWGTIAGTTLPGGTLGGVIGSDGLFILQVMDEDLAGNSSLSNQPITFDTVAPVTTAVYLPPDESCGHPVAIDGIFEIHYSEALDPAAITAGIYLDGSPNHTASVSGPNVIFTAASELVLDGNYSVVLSNAADMAGNASPDTYNLDFTTGAIFWSLGPVMYKSPITPRMGWTDSGTVSWIDDAFVITDIEVEEGTVYWSTEEGEIYSTSADQFPAASWSDVNVVRSESFPVEDIELWVDDVTLYYTTRTSGGTTVHGTNLSGTMHWVKNDDAAKIPYALYGDADGDVYWANQPFTQVYTSHSAQYEPTVMMLNMPRLAGLAVRYPFMDSRHHVYGLVNFEAGGVTMPPQPNETTYIERLDLNHNWTSTYTLENSRSLTISEGTLWGNGTDYGGDLELVETGGISALFAIAPTINGAAAEVSTNEYCAVFRMDLDLTTDTKLYDPASLGLIGTWSTTDRHGAIGVMTE